MPQINLDPARAIAAGLGDTFGEKFLGLREDREEITYWVDRSAWLDAARYLRESTTFNVLEDLNVVDYLDRNPRFDLAIMLMSLEPIASIRLKTLIPEEQPEVASLCSVWKGANWYEREMYDLFGVHFVGHPDQRRLLMPADWQGHPLRKDYPVTGPATSAYR
jgi:NADH-quinone oxidoreductase subunit C